MKIRTAAALFGGLLLAVFGALSFSLLRAMDLLNFEAHELFKAGESVRVAQELKVQLLASDRNTLLYQRENDPARFEGGQLQEDEMGALLKAAETLVNSTTEEKVMADVKQRLGEYLGRRDLLAKSIVDPLKRYNLVSRDEDRAISAVENLEAVNRAEMTTFTGEVTRQNEEAHQVAILLFMFGGVVLSGIVVAIFRSVARPLTGIAHVIARYSAGDPAVRITPTGLREIREIGSNFNSMAQSLEERRQDRLRFIASIAHDLRNPLNSMSMASGLMMQQVRSDDRRLFEIFHRQVQNLDRLVGDLLDTTRIEAGHLELKLSCQDLNPIILDAVALRGTHSDLHRVETQLASDPLICNCDSGRIMQVLNNLLSNAFKYSPIGGTILVKSWQEKERIMVSVSDEGIGIAPRDLQQIFKPFKRTQVTKDTIPGIGLGLSASRRIIEAHGGTLQVESVAGTGSTFYISLPRNPCP